MNPVRLGNLKGDQFRSNSKTGFYIHFEFCSQSYDHELQRQRCKILHHHEYVRFENKNILFYF
jgi:hypothetical protein